MIVQPHGLRDLAERIGQDLPALSMVVRRSTFSAAAPETDSMG